MALRVRENKHEQLFFSPFVLCFLPSTHFPLCRAKKKNFSNSSAFGNSWLRMEPGAARLRCFLRHRRCMPPLRNGPLRWGPCPPPRPPPLPPPPLLPSPAPHRGANLCSPRLCHLLPQRFLRSSDLSDCCPLVTRTVSAVPLFVAPFALGSGEAGVCEFSFSKFSFPPTQNSAALRVG